MRRERTNGLDGPWGRRERWRARDVKALDCGEPFPPLDPVRKARLERGPDIAHVNAAERLVGKIGEVDAESRARFDQRALMQAFAVDERAVDVPGDRAKEAHGASRPARAR